MVRILAHHKRNCNAVRKLREKAYHLVMLFRRKLGYHAKAHYSAKLLAGLDSFGRILIRGRHDVVCALEYLHARVFNAAALAAGHGVRADKLKVRPQHVLNFIDYAAFYAGNVAYKRIGLNVLLIFVYPLYKRMRIHCENQQVKLPDIFGVYLGSAVLYYPLAQGIVYRLLPPCDGADLKAVRGERLGVAAAHKAKAEYKYFRVFIKLHILPPNRWS